MICQVLLKMVHKVSAYIELSFLYGRDQMPTEEEQFEAYKEVLGGNERKTCCCTYFRYRWR